MGFKIEFICSLNYRHYRDNSHCAKNWCLIQTMVAVYCKECFMSEVAGDAFVLLNCYIDVVHYYVRT